MKSKAKFKKSKIDRIAGMNDSSKSMKSFGNFNSTVSILIVATMAIAALLVPMSFASGWGLFFGNVTATAFYDKNGTSYFIDPAANNPNHVSAIFNGSVGIGTTSPGRKLNIVGDGLKIQNGGNVVLEMQTTSGGNLWRWQAEDDMLQLYDASASQTRLEIQNDGDVIINTGNVGIGTTSPSAKLDVNGNITVDSGNAYKFMSNSNVYLKEYWGLELHGAGAYPVQIPDTSLLIGYDQTSPTDRGSGNLLVSGNVGIGTTNPQGKLHVSTSGDSNALVVNDTTGNVGIGTTSPGSPLEIKSSRDGILRLREIGGGWNYIEFYNDTSRTLWLGMNSDKLFGINNQVYLNTETGNVGIGSSGLGSKLGIVGSGATDASIRIENSDTGGRSWWLSSGTPGVEASKFNIYDGTAGKSRLTIDSSGNVGIGTTSPAYKLQVDAGNSSNPGIGVNGYIKATGSITANTGLDLAERFPAGAELPSAGELIAVGPNGTVVRTSSPYQANEIGVVSTKPGFALSGGYNSTNSVLVALSGRVPVRVSLENGPIKPGDLLTSSSTPGVAMKATKSGRVIGMALESFDGKSCTSSECFGTIRVFVNPHWARIGSKVVSISSNYTTDGQSIIGVSTIHGSVTVTLSSKDCKKGNIVVIKDEGGNASSNPIVIVSEIGKIDGKDTYIINKNYGFVKLYNNGSDWFAID